RLDKSGFSADIPIVVQSDSLNLASKLRINSRDDDIDVDFSVSEGNIRNDSINADEITGKVEVSIKDGVLKKAISNFVLASPEMKLTIDAKAQQIITMTSGTNKFDIETQIVKTTETSQKNQPYITKAKFVSQGASFKGNLDAFEGSLPTTQIVVDNLLIDDFSAVKMLVRLPCRIEYNNKKASLFLSNTSTVELSNSHLVTDDKEFTIKHLQKIFFLKDEKPLLSARLNERNLELMPHAVMKIDSVVNMFHGYESTPITLKLPLSTLSGKFSTETDFTYSIENGNIKTSDVNLEGITAEFSYKPEETSTIAIDVNNLAIGDFVTPLFTSIVAESNAGQFAFDASFKLQDGSPFFVASGVHDLSNDSGYINTSMQNIVFRDGSMQPADYFPFLKGKVSSATGVLGFGGKIAWQKSQML
ncbi:MAG: hypothetical protein KAJ75_05560, partial [Alphaproteobacteria bacterium]|nr:hypothetical protein [Alphaproteobacteria bacterium]